MVAADSGAGINYAQKTGHLSTGDLKAFTPGRWDTPEEGPRASTPERQETSAHRGLGVFTPEARTRHLSSGWFCSHLLDTLCHALRPLPGPKEAGVTINLSIISRAAFSTLSL